MRSRGLVAALDDLHRPAGELADLRFPLVLHRRRGDDQDALDAAFLGEQLGGGHRLHGLAEAHVVAEDAAAAAGGEQAPRIW